MKHKVPVKEKNVVTDVYSVTARASRGRNEFLQAYHIMTADLFAPLLQEAHRQGQTVTVKGIFREVV